MKIDFSSGSTLKAKEMNGPITARITDVQLEEFDNGKKYTVGLDNTDKRFVLNVTNGRILTAALGDETDHWTGATIEISVVQVNYQGQMVPGLTVKVLDSVRQTGQLPLLDHETFQNLKPRIEQGIREKGIVAVLDGLKGRFTLDDDMQRAIQRLDQPDFGSTPGPDDLGF